MVFGAGAGGAVAALVSTVSAGAHSYRRSHHRKKRNVTLELSVLGTFQAAGRPFDEGAAEIVAHDPETQRLFVINGATDQVDVLDCQDPSSLQLLFSIDLSPYGSSPTSVDVKDGLAAVSVVAPVKTDPGKVVFFDTDGDYLNDVTVGSLPDMVIFTPDGKRVLVAYEAEPALEDNAALGRLIVTTTMGATDNDGDYDELYVPGARSFFIWNERGKLVYDSGDMPEQITKDALPANFNSNNTDNDFDSRSDSKGPETGRRRRCRAVEPDGCLCRPRTDWRHRCF